MLLSYESAASRILVHIILFRENGRRALHERSRVDLRLTTSPNESSSDPQDYIGDHRRSLACGSNPHGHMDW